MNLRRLTLTGADRDHRAYACNWRSGGYGGTFSNPYWRTCPTCKGTGINPVMKWMTCPKCKGETKVRGSA